MAIKTEQITNGVRELIKHFSDSNKYILQVETGIEYEEAIDVMPCRYTYEETEKEVVI
jgi:hypothetical protein